MIIINFYKQKCEFLGKSSLSELSSYFKQY